MGAIKQHCLVAICPTAESTATENTVPSYDSVNFQLLTEFNLADTIHCRHMFVNSNNQPVDSELDILMMLDTWC
jgi:hypothetical protein